MFSENFFVWIRISGQAMTKAPTLTFSMTQIISPLQKAGNCSWFPSKAAYWCLLTVQVKKLSRCNWGLRTQIRISFLVKMLKLCCDSGYTWLSHDPGCGSPLLRFHSLKCLRNSVFETLSSQDRTKPQGANEEILPNAADNVTGRKPGGENYAFLLKLINQPNFVSLSFPTPRKVRVRRESLRSPRHSQWVFLQIIFLIFSFCFSRNCSIFFPGMRLSTDLCLFLCWD